MYYFVSDVHLKSDNSQESISCQKRFLEWLDSVGSTAREIYLLGDIFDFWYEYKKVVPKGFVRVLAKFAELTERGVRVVFIAGNHDMWVRDYFSVECGVEIYTTPQIIDIVGHRVFVAHGDNLNISKNWTLRLMNRGFRSPLVRTLFSTLVHPDMALKFGQWWSSSSRKRHDKYNDDIGSGVDTLVEYVCANHDKLQCGYYIFGHMHKVVQRGHKEAYILLMNDWSNTPHYIEFTKEGEVAIKEV